jgi:nucleoside-diphosphate-sugar epimerase
MIQSANWRIVATPLGRKGWISAIHCHDLVRGIVLAGEKGQPLPGRCQTPEALAEQHNAADGYCKHALEGGGQESNAAVNKFSAEIGKGIYFFDDGGRYTIGSFGHDAAAALGKKAFTLAMPRPAIWLSAVAAECAGRISGKSPALNRDKVTATFATGWWCDASKARDELGFVAEMPLEKGLPQTVAWLREHQIL